jgi:hypothetical protein
LQISLGASHFSAPLDKLDEAYHEAIPRLMSQTALSGV